MEMDTIVGKNNKGAIVTIIDRSTDWLLEPYLKWIKTITTDNGSEFFRHEYIAKKLGAKVYFADPHAPCQKGGIENTNGLIR